MPTPKPKKPARGKKDSPAERSGKVIDLEPKRAVPPKGKKKKRDGVTGDQDRDRKFFKKKISFRKKEVVEGAALYGKGRRDRKGRKGARGKSSAHTMKTQITTPKITNADRHPKWEIK